MGKKMRPGVLLQVGAEVCSVHSFYDSAPLTGQFSFMLYSIFPYVRLPNYPFVWGVHRVRQFTKKESGVVCSLHVNSVYSGYSAHTVFRNTLV